MAIQVETRWIDATSEAGKMAIFIAEPTGSGPYPGIAYCHALPGINQQHRSMAERIAAEGYVVAIPDLFNRISYRTEFRLPDERDQAQAARQSLYVLRARRRYPAGTECVARTRAGRPDPAWRGRLLHRWDGRLPRCHGPPGRSRSRRDVRGWLGQSRDHSSRSRAMSRPGRLDRLPHALAVGAWDELVPPAKSRPLQSA